MKAESTAPFEDGREGIENTDEIERIHRMWRVSSSSQHLINI